MAWFKFGKQDDKVRTPGPTESVDAMRKRALMRLIGSAVLVLGAVVGFPLLFDSQPRSVQVDIPIEIPDKTKTKPLTLPVPSQGGAPLATTPAPSTRIDDTASLSGKEEIVKPTKSAGEIPAKNTDKSPVQQDNTAQPAIKSVVPGSNVTSAATPAPDDTARAKAAADKATADKAKADKLKADKEKADKAKADKAKSDKDKSDKDKSDKDKVALDASRAKALLDGQAAEAKAADAKPEAAATGERFIVQFGAFTDVAKSREVRQKVEKAGLKTYSQVAKTATGELIRVRVGPFTNRAEADKAAAKIKALDLPASVLTL